MLTIHAEHRLGEPLAAGAYECGPLRLRAASTPALQQSPHSGELSQCGTCRAEQALLVIHLRIIDRCSTALADISDLPTIDADGLPVKPYSRYNGRLKVQSIMPLVE